MDVDRTNDLTRHSVSRPAASVSTPRQGGLGADQVRLELDHLERVLEREDPRLAGRLRRLQRRERRNEVTVFGLLALSVVLLAVALATNTWVCWLAGAAAFVASFAVDNRYRRRLTTTKVRMPTRPSRSAGDPRRARVMGDVGASIHPSGEPDIADAADAEAVAQSRLPHEKQDVTDEGGDLGASNLGELALSGTDCSFDDDDTWFH